MIKEYIFHYDFNHISDITDNDDWYGDFPVLLTEEEYNAMLETHKKWYKSEEWIENKEQDDEFFLHRYCPDVHKKVRAALNDYAIKNWRDEVVRELDQADFYMPDEIYYESDPEFYEDAQSY